MADKFNLDGFSVDTNNICRASGGFVGDVLGNVTGTVIGDLLGDVEGNLVGNLNGNVYGRVFLALSSNYGGDGAIALTDDVSVLDASIATTDMTLANGSEGKILYIVCSDATNSCTITPSSLLGGTTITFNAAGDSVQLLSIDTGSSWAIIGGNSYTVS